MKALTATILAYARLTLFLGCLCAIALLAGALKVADLVSRRQIDRTPWAQRCFRGATRCLGLRAHCHGEAHPGPVLYVCNHVSWCDIPVLGGALPARFLSKSEVGQWPLIGWLARQGGTVFIKRGGGKAADVVRQLADLLSQGQSVMVFPEGTTSTGITVLPFHGRLLRAAREAGTPIQPISIVYRRNGQPDHLAPFINDDDFLGHLTRLLRRSPPRVDILMHPPVSATGPETPSELAAALRASVLEGITSVQSISPATDNRQRLPRRLLHASR
jgi:1-acyl-sn-glycerol-3-phosphate acyltransferase